RANLIDAIAARRQNATLPRLLGALGIPGVGRALATELAAHFGSLQALESASEEPLLDMGGIAPPPPTRLHAWCADQHNRELLEKLRRHGVAPKADGRAKAAADGPLAGKLLVVTGTL